MALPSLGSLTPTAMSPLPSIAARMSSPTPADGFGRVLQGLLAENGAAQATADEAVRAVATGEADDLHSVSLALAKADLSFRLILELRNRLAESFQEVSRMQV